MTSKTTWDVGRTVRRKIHILDRSVCVCVFCECESNGTTPFETSAAAGALWSDRKSIRGESTQRYSIPGLMFVQGEGTHRYSLPELMLVMVGRLSRKPRQNKPMAVRCSRKIKAVPTAGRCNGISRTAR